MVPPLKNILEIYYFLKICCFKHGFARLALVIRSDDMVLLMCHTCSELAYKEKIKVNLYEPGKQKNEVSSLLFYNFSDYLKTIFSS